MEKARENLVRGSLLFNDYIAVSTPFPMDLHLDQFFSQSSGGSVWFWVCLFVVLVCPCPFGMHSTFFW